MTLVAHGHGGQVGREATGLFRSERHGEEGTMGYFAASKQGWGRF